MTLIKHLALALTAGLFALNTLAATTEVNGVKVEDNAMVNGVKLQLNGAGTRYKGPFKVYVADIYASKKVGSLNELVAAPGPKRLTMTMLREIEAGPFGKLLTRGMVVTAKGKVQSEPFKEPEFFKAMMSIWLGPVPADWKLKDALLGVK